MDIKGKTILVLGGWGLVGQAICRRLIPEKPGKIVITSLHKRDADSMAEWLKQEVKGSDIEIGSECSCRITHVERGGVL